MHCVFSSAWAEQVFAWFSYSGCSKCQNPPLGAVRALTFSFSLHCDTVTLIPLVLPVCSSRGCTALLLLCD